MMVSFLSIVTIVLFGACNTEDDLLQQSVSDRTPISFRVEGGTTRATFINSGNFNSLVKTLNVSAFTSDGKVYIKTVQLKNDGNGNFTFPNSDDVYYWPEKNTKLTFVAWAGDNISVDDQGNVSYTIENDNSKQLDQLICKTSALSSTDCPNGKVSLDLGHAYAAIEFKAGKKFTPETVTFDGITFNVAAGAGFIKPGTYNSWVKGTKKPSDTSTYFHIQGKWKSGDYSHDLERNCPLPDAFKNVQAGKIYQISIANEDTIGYDDNGEPDPVVPDGAVDLGLSVFWASCNLGASKPEEYGKYYAWADTIGYQIADKHNFIPSSTPYAYSPYGDSDFSKYKSQNQVLESTDDAAHHTLGEPWCIPTKEQFEELINNCTTNVFNLNGVYGYKIIAKNGNWIFIPASSFMIGNSLVVRGSHEDNFNTWAMWYTAHNLIPVSGYGNGGCAVLWSSTLNGRTGTAFPPIGYAWAFCLYDPNNVPSEVSPKPNIIFSQSASRQFGCPIRPVHP